MKKIVLSILCIIAIVVAIILVKISDNNMKKNDVSSFNSQFEEYRNKTIYGADILSIINKAIDNNETYKNAKEDYFIKIYLTLLTKDKEGNITEITYPMERLVEVRTGWIY